MVIIPDYDSLKSSRKALYAASFSVLLLANLNFTSTKFGLLGLEIHFDQSRLVALGQILLAILLIVFLLRSLPSYISIFSDFWANRIKFWHMQASDDLDNIWIPGREHDDGPSGDRDRLQEILEWKIKKLENSKMKWSARLTFFVWIVVDLFIPFGIAFIAITEPYALSTLVDHVSVQTEVSNQ